MEARKKKSSRLLAWVVVIAVAFTMTFPTAFVWGAETDATQETVVTEDQTPGEEPAVEESSNKDPTKAVQAETETKKAAKKAAAKTDTGNEDAAKIDGQGYATLAAAIEAADNSTIVLQNDVTEDVVIPTGKTITLDLNEKTLTNVKGHTIVNSGSLTVTGKGTVDNVTHGKAALYNKQGAIAELNGGTYTRSKENGINSADNGGNSFYNIQNQGTLTINKTVAVSQTGHFSSMIANGWQNGAQNSSKEPATMTINGGMFDGGLNTVKNDDYGVMNINDGTFKNVTQAAFLNWNEATVNGGEFVSEKDTILNGKLDDTMDKGQLTITGGTFTAGGTGLVVQKMGGSETIGEVSISGGTFSTNPSDYLATGYVAAKKDGAYKVVAGEGIAAAIGDDEYPSLAAAIEAAKDGQTVKLLQDVTVNEKIIVKEKKTITLDLGGKKIIGGDDLLKNKHTQPIEVNGGASLTITGKGQINGEKAYAAVGVMGAGSLIVEDGTLVGQYYGIAGNGLAENAGTEITIKGGEIKGIAADDNAAIYHPQDGKLSISGGTLEGATGVQMCAGEGSISITGGKIIAAGQDKKADKVEGDGLICDGAAISLVSRNYPGGDPSLTISAGEFTSANNDAVVAYKWNSDKTWETWTDAADHLKISGGTFSTNPSDYLAKDYAVNQTNEGYKVVKTADASGEAFIGKTYFDTVAAAIKAAKANDTVKLNKDVQVSMDEQNPAAILIQKNITLDGNGKTITATGDKKEIGHVIEVSEDAKAVVKNLTIDGGQTAKHGIQVYSKAGMQSEVKVTSVAVKNCTGYGFMVNGGKMTATRITADANGWGGVNIGQGQDVTLEPSFIFNSGTLQDQNPIQADNVGTNAPKVSWVTFGVNAGTWYATKSVRDTDKKTLIQWNRQLAGEAQTDGVTYPTLKEAIAAAESGTEVKLLKDVEVGMGTDKNAPAILIDKSITLDGNGKTITANKEAAEDGVGHVIGVQTPDVQIMNLTIDGNNGAARHGIQTYGTGSTAALTDVTIEDCYGYAVVANGSTVTADGLYTSGNGWGGVNVTKGKDVTEEPGFVFNYGDLQEDNPIQIDNVDKNAPVDAAWVAFGPDMDADWHHVTTTDDEGKTIIQFALGAAIEDISLNTEEMTLTEGDKGQLIARISPEEAYDTSVSWTVENDSEVVTVDENGIVTAEKEGKATVTATAADGDTKAKCTITVAKKAETADESVKVIVAPSVTTNEDNETIINEDDIIQAISNAQEKEEVVVRVPENASPVLSEDVFMAANESDAAKLVVEVPAKGNDTYAATFEFETSAIDKTVSVNTEIKKMRVPEKTGLPADAAAVGLAISHEGDFPAPATITITVNDETIKDGDTVYIYYLNNNEKLQLIDNGPLTVKDGKVTFTLSHASEYVISNEPIEPADAADIVDALIGKIGTVVYTDDVYQAIKAAKDAYNGFEKQYEGQTNLVEKYAALKAADEQYTKLDDQVKAFKAAVDDLYYNIEGAMTYAQQKKVEELTAAYKALNDDQITALEDYEWMYEDVLAARDASKDAEAVSQANCVSKLVDQLPATASYSAADKSKIDAARNMYNSVIAETPAAKALLTADLAKIEKAEAEYKNAKRAAYTNARISLSTTQYVYNDKVKTPAVYGLSAFVNGTDYTVAYSNNKKTGKATVTVTGKGDCAGLSAKTATFRITPAKAAISKLKKGKKSFKVTIKSQKSAGVSGYQISYSLKKNKSFKSTTTTKTSKTVKKLKAKRTYYVKVRSYKTIDGKKYYGSYSKIKKIKTR